MSLGDAQSYVLTTADNELGVAIATSEAGTHFLSVVFANRNIVHFHSFISLDMEVV